MTKQRRLRTKRKRENPVVSSDCRPDHHAIEVAIYRHLGLIRAACYAPRVDETTIEIAQLVGDLCRGLPAKVSSLQAECASIRWQLSIQKKQMRKDQEYIELLIDETKK